MPWRLALALLATPAAAQTNCLPIGDIARVLAERYGETVQGAGVEAWGGMTMIFAGPTGSWSLVIVDTSTGDACIERFGQGYLGAPPAGELM